MSRSRTRLGVGFSLVLLAGPRASWAQAPVIDHKAVACVVADKFSSFEARFDPAENVSRARIYFRAEGGQFWYFVDMKPQGGVFQGVTPKPKNSLKRINYYVDVIDRAFAESRTAEYAPEVVRDAGVCSKKMAVANVASLGSVTVGASPGAPAIPAGFSASGVVPAGATAGAAAGTTARTGAAGAAAGGLSGAAITGIVVGGAAAVAGGVAVATHRSSSGPPTTTAPPGAPATTTPTPASGANSLEILSANPPPGGTVSVNHDFVTLSVRALSTVDISNGAISIGIPSSTNNCFRDNSGTGGNHVGNASLRAGQSSTFFVTFSINFPGMFWRCSLPFSGSTMDVRLIGSVVLQSPAFPIDYTYVQ